MYIFISEDLSECTVDGNPWLCRLTTITVWHSMLNVSDKYFIALL